MWSELFGTTNKWFELNVFVLLDSRLTVTQPSLILVTFNLLLCVFGWIYYERIHCMWYVLCRKAKTSRVLREKTTPSTTIWLAFIICGRFGSVNNNNNSSFVAVTKAAGYVKQKKIRIHKFNILIKKVKVKVSHTRSRAYGAGSDPGL